MINKLISQKNLKYVLDKEKLQDNLVPSKDIMLQIILHKRDLFYAL